MEKFLSTLIWQDSLSKTSCAEILKKYFLPNKAKCRTLFFKEKPGEVSHREK